MQTNLKFKSPKDYYDFGMDIDSKDMKLHSFDRYFSNHNLRGMHKLQAMKAYYNGLCKLTVKY